MRCKILHECKCRIRLHAMVNRMSLEEADQLENYLNASPVIQHAKVYERTCDMVIQYDGSREEVVKVIAAFQFDREALVESTPEKSSVTSTLTPPSASLITGTASMPIER